MCTTSVNMDAINQRLHAHTARATDSFCHSPSSIAEVDSSRDASSDQPAKRRKTSGADSPSSQSQHHPVPLSPVPSSPPTTLLDATPLLVQQGDTADAAQSICASALDAALAAVDAAGSSSDAVAIITHSSSCASTRKRRFSEFVSPGETSNASNHDDSEHSSSSADRELLLQDVNETPEQPASDGTATQSLSAAVSTSTIATVAATAPSTSIAFHDVPPHAVHGIAAAESLADITHDRADAAAVCDVVLASGAAATTTTTTAIRGASRRTLYIEYWSRTDECKERKWDHLDAIADQYGCAEDHIFATTLRKRTACLEPNMFPYATPAGIEHWTLWHERDLAHSQIKQYVENWIDANAPHVESWNYDDNPERSIDIFHVHVYLQVPSGATVLQGRTIDDLVHELD